MMNDLISRKWLIECVEEGWIKFETEKDKNKFIHLVRDTAPSAQPERIRGRWIKMSDADRVYYCCSECGEELYRLWSFDREFDLVPHKVSIAQTRYCPNCGADMRGEE